MKIQSFDRDIEGVFKPNYYKIPRFQRPYSWDVSNVLEFYNDTIVEREDEYFIGSIVIYKDSEATYGLVDGQQRMTTITMMLCALRNIFQDVGLRNHALGLHGLIERADINNQQQYVLQTETSYPYFHEKIQNFSPGAKDPIEIGDEEENLEKAFKFLNDRFQQVVKLIQDDPSLSERQKKNHIEKRLIDIRNKILRLKLILIELDNEEDAYLIFETLNTRGKDLGVSDLVKNHLTKLLRKTNQHVDLPKDKWEKILGTFESSQADLDINRFLHHYWLSRHDFTTEKKLYKQIRRQISKENAKDFLDNLISEAELYRQIHEPSVRKWNIEEMDIRDSLDALSMFSVRQQVPLVLSVFRDLLARKIKVGQAKEAFAALESFYFVFTAVTGQRPSGGLGMMFAKYGRELHSAVDSQMKANVLAEFRKKLRDTKPTYFEFEASFRAIRLAPFFSRDKKLVQYILKRTYRHQFPHSSVDFSRMTIEHILPIAKAGGLQYAGQIGNLVLIEDKLNSEKLADKPFAKKKELFKAHGANIDPEILEASDWTAKEIEARTKRISTLAYEKIWKL